MPTSYPGGLDAFVNPAAADAVENANDALDHHAQHSNANDAIEAIEAELGAWGRNVFAGPVLRSGRYYFGHMTGGNTGGATFDTTRPVFGLFIARRAVTLDRIGISVTTAAASTVARLGIYRDDGTGFPGALLLDAGEVDVSTTGGKEIIISQAITPGAYWLTMMTNGSTVTIESMPQGSQNGWFGYGTLTANGAGSFSYEAGPQTYGPLAANASAYSPGISNKATPVRVRVA